MTGFSRDWLDLRAAADLTARDATLAQMFADAVGPSPRLLDLGSGTGASVAALSRVLPRASWTLTDHDPDLLAEAARRHPEVETVTVDLATDLEALLERDCDAMTASALIDLVSEDWLARLAEGAQGRPLHIALTCDGADDWSPEDADDAAVVVAFRQHQRRDKGFGPALGPDAAPRLAALLRAQGYRVQLAASPWRLRASEDAALIAVLAEGMATAAHVAGLDPAVAQGWAERRRMASACRIGHLDLVALPARGT